MSANFHDDEIMGKAYDSRLMKRLLKYAKPYWHYLLLVIAMMVVITGLELLRPYLLKVTIDDYISGYKKPMYELELDSPYEGIAFNGYKYVKLQEIEEDIDSYPIVNITNVDDKYYLGNME
ncbi:MAG: hypothetical protein WCY46_07625, partial [Tissierellaceae bacterium]